MATKPKPAVSRWIVSERKRVSRLTPEKPMKPGDIATRMTELGYPVKEGTVRVWEAGRTPSPENIEGLERVFGTLAPTSEGTGPGDTLTVPSELLTVLRDQTKALTALTEQMAADRQLIRDLLEALAGRADLAETFRADAAEAERLAGTPRPPQPPGPFERGGEPRTAHPETRPTVPDPS